MAGAPDPASHPLNQPACNGLSPAKADARAWRWAAENGADSGSCMIWSGLVGIRIRWNRVAGLTSTGSKENGQNSLASGSVRDDELA
jgi:hypothetical protein